MVFLKYQIILIIANQSHILTKIKPVNIEGNNRKVKKNYLSKIERTHPTFKSKNNHAYLNQIWMNEKPRLNKITKASLISTSISNYGKVWNQQFLML